LVAAPDLPNAKSLNHPTDLMGQPCLTFRGDRPGANWRFLKGTEEAMVEVNGPIAVRSFTILKELVMAGEGFGFLPAFVLERDLDAARLHLCLPGWASPGTPVYLTFRPGVRNIARIAAVLDTAQELLPQLLDP
ncbi:MAG: LysR substrate-binding domain-containing protein, partial [Pseudomonadota bacterium]